MGAESRARRLRRAKTRADAELVRAVVTNQPLPPGLGQSSTVHVEMSPAEAQRILQWADNLPPWTPFVRAKINAYAGGRTREQMVSEIMARTGETREAVEAFTADIESEEIWINSRYQVNIRRQQAAEGSGMPELVHLSIKRLDKLALGRERFRDLQRIKNELVGPECEGVEVYPAESRLVDTSNQYHLWCFADPAFRIPWGFEGRIVTEESIAGSVQQPFEEGHGPEHT